MNTERIKMTTIKVVYRQDFIHGLPGYALKVFTQDEKRTTLEVSFTCVENFIHFNLCNIYKEIKNSTSLEEITRDKIKIYSYIEGVV